MILSATLYVQSKALLAVKGGHGVSSRGVIRINEFKLYRAGTGRNKDGFARYSRFTAIDRIYLIAHKLQIGDELAGRADTLVKDKLRHIALTTHLGLLLALRHLYDNEYDQEQHQYARKEQDKEIGVVYENLTEIHSVLLITSNYA